ncbi:hypothetical protein Ddc_17512 [Ditylenchus destructor]|nr:hypothetical protein Ddc_17512 [Ditylenchus destructor]
MLSLFITVPILFSVVNAHLYGGTLYRYKRSGGGGTVPSGDRASSFDYTTIIDAYGDRDSQRSASGLDFNLTHVRGRDGQRSGFLMQPAGGSQDDNSPIHTSGTTRRSQDRKNNLLDTLDQLQGDHPGKNRHLQATQDKLQGIGQMGTCDTADHPHGLHEITRKCENPHIPRK